MDNYFTLRLNLDNITKGAKDIEYIANNIDRAINAGMEELAQKMKIRITSLLIGYGLGDSSLINDIEIIPMGEGMYIGIGHEYAVFVEYGTGITGSLNPPHPNGAMNGWIHNTRKNGWYYPTVMSNPYFQTHSPYYINGVPYAWTKGMRSRPFMYQTWLYGSQIATQTIRKHINNLLGERFNR